MNLQKINKVLSETVEDLSEGKDSVDLLHSAKNKMMQAVPLLKALEKKIAREKSGGRVVAGWATDLENMARLMDREALRMTHQQRGYNK